MKLTAHMHLVQKFRIGGAVPAEPIYFVMKWCLIKHMYECTLVLQEFCRKWSALLKDCMPNNNNTYQRIEKTKFIYSNLPCSYLICKIYERRKWKNFSNEEGRTNFGRLRTNWKEPHHSQGGIYWQNKWWDHRIWKNRMLWLNVLEDKDLGWKKINGIQIIGIEASQRRIVVDQRQILKILENYVTEL